MDGTFVLSGPNPVVGMRGDRRVPFVRSGIFITFVTRMMEAFRRRYASLGADSLVALWLGIWWVCNVAQAGLAQLANDEAYYHLFAERLAWGYFDHPPVTALLVWLGERLFGGELGVRFFFTVLQPLYLWILWRLIRPADASRRDAGLFVVLASTTLMLQIYGFIAVPDGPLLMTSALFLLAFERFSERRPRAWLWMGVAMALMAYSKYHGALVVLFSLAANPRLLRRPTLYLSGAVAALLLVPHLIWQYNHDWASFVYHLSSRNSVFRFDYVVEFLANHPQVEKVNHPSLPDHPDHALYEKYFPNGGASIFTFNIKGGREEAFKFIDNLKVFSLLANVADVKSLVIHPASTTHSQLNDEELAEQQIYQNTIRLSIGTEHIDDIIADLEAGFAAVQGQ